MASRELSVKGMDELDIVESIPAGSYVPMLNGSTKKTVRISVNDFLGNTPVENIFYPEDYGAKGDAVGAHDGVWDGTWFSSASYTATSADVGKLFFIDGNQRVVTAVGTGANAGKWQTSAAPYGSTGILWLMTTDDTAAIQSALDAARNVQGNYTEDNTPTDQMIISGGIVMLKPGKAYGIFNSSASYNAGAGKLGALTVYRRTSLVGSGISSHRSGLVLIPGSYGHMISNTSATSYTDYVTIGNLTLWGYSDWNNNALNGLNFYTPTSSFDKIDAFNRFFNITVVKAKQDGFSIGGRGELLIQNCDAFNCVRYGAYINGQYDWKMMGCNFGANRKTGLRIYNSGAANVTNIKCFYNGVDGGSNDEDCANLVLDGDINNLLRSGFVWMSDIQLQESRGCAAVIKTGNNTLHNVQFLDPVRSVLGGGSLPTVKAGLYLKGEGCRLNTIYGIVSPSVMVYQATNWPANTDAVYIDGVDGNGAGPQLNQGEIYTYRQTINLLGGTQVGIQYSGSGVNRNGGGFTNGKNIGFKVDDIINSCTVANLPSAASVKGKRAFVTDANATTFASTVAGGGANNVPVYSDGTNWKIG